MRYDFLVQNGEALETDWNAVRRLVSDMTGETAHSLDETGIRALTRALAVAVDHGGKGALTRVYAIVEDALHLIDDLVPESLRLMYREPQEGTMGRTVSFDGGPPIAIDTPLRFATAMLAQLAAVREFDGRAWSSRAPTPIHLFEAVGDRDSALMWLDDLRTSLADDRPLGRRHAFNVLTYKGGFDKTVVIPVERCIKTIVHLCSLADDGDVTQHAVDDRVAHFLAENLVSQNLHHRDWRNLLGVVCGSRRRLLRTETLVHGHYEDMMAVVRSASGILKQAEGNILAAGRDAYTLLKRRSSSRLASTMDITVIEEPRWVPGFSAP